MNPVLNIWDWTPRFIHGSTFRVAVRAAHWGPGNNPVANVWNWSAVGAMSGSTYIYQTYRTIRAHWIGNRYFEDGVILTEGVDIPHDWVPTLAVEPLTTNATLQFYNAGPRGIAWEDLNQWQGSVWANVAPPSTFRPATYWVKQGSQFILTGLGAGLPPKV